MANIDNFTPDEQTMILLILSKSVMVKRLVDIDDTTIEQLNDALTVAILTQFVHLTDEQLRQAIDNARTSAASGIAHHRNQPNSMFG